MAKAVNGRRWLQQLSVIVVALIAAGVPLGTLSAETQSQPKEQVCHRPPGNPANYNTITVGTDAVAAHLAHGDLLGACASQCDALCDDGNACTTDHGSWDPVRERCTCSHSAVVCVASDQCHLAGTCNPATGQCSNAAAANGTACNDGNACTQADVCQAGVCVGGNPVVCAVSDQCHLAGTCDSATGQCSNPAAANGAACSDGNACTRTDVCQAGVCVGSNPVVCTSGTCNATTGLCPDPPLITGVVRDRATGLPIPNAQLFFYGGGYGFTSTDASGHYTFTLSQIQSFGGALSGNLYVGATGYFEAPPISVSDLGAQPVLPVVQDVLLRPGGPVVRGTVRDASTTLGIAGATVSFNRNPMSTFRGGATTDSVQTGADGSYAIDSSSFNESALTSGFSVFLMVNAGGYLGQTRSRSFTSYPITEDFALTASSTPLLTGIVRDRVTTQPIANAGVFFYGGGYGTVSTDANGRYTFTGAQIQSFGGALSGNLYVGATGYFEAPPISVSDLSAQPVLPVVHDVSLLAGGSIVVGTVRSASTTLGIVGATVSFNRNPMSTFRGGATTESVQTAADGSYAIDSSSFNESALTSGFSINLLANAGGYLGQTRSRSFTSYPITEDFTLTAP